MTQVVDNRAAVWQERDSEVISPAYARYSHLVVEEAQGAHLHTADGRDVLDFGCGIAVTNLGHRHPAVVAAVHEQVDRLWHTSVTALHPTMIEAAQRLIDIAPAGLDQVFFSNSGTEAIEGAIKLARRATGRSEIIAFTGAFHGRTYGSMTLTASKAKYREKMGPFLPGVHHVRYPYCFRYCTHGAAEPCPIARGYDIRLLFSTSVISSSVAAVIVEPVQGEGGFVVPPSDFMPTLRELCDEFGILLVADEVQTGFGRTGKMFALEHTGTVPDIMCVAKALGNGLPIGAIVARHALMQSWSPGQHGTTFGGNAVSCAAAVAVMETMQRERIPERSAQLGARALQRVRTWQERVPQLADVRGLGLMIGLEFMREGRPDKDMATRVHDLALEGGLLLLTCGPDENVIRLLPPLNIPEAELDQGLDILERSLEQAAR